MASLFSRLKRTITLIGLTCILAGSAGGFTTALAQSPMDVFIGESRTRVSRSYQPEAFYPPLRGFNTSYSRELPVITVYPPQRGGPGGVRTIPRVAVPDHSTTENSGGPRAFCVRACDGFFFPAPVGLGSVRQESYCQAACPGAETRLFSLRSYGTINAAADQRGMSYAALKTAFQFRTRVSASCTCSGSLTGGLVRLSITNDRTLQAGDAVMLSDGIRVFAGASRFPYAPTDFVELRRYRRLPTHITQSMARLETASMADTGSAGARSPEGLQRRGARIPVKVIAPVPEEGRAQVRVIDINHKIGKSQL